jgi:hypothetical protein
MAYLPVDLAREGVELEIDARGRRCGPSWWRPF